MPFANAGLSGLILIALALLLFVKPSKLPELGRAFGRGLKEFRDATRDLASDPSKKAPPPQEIPPSHDPGNPPV